MPLRINPRQKALDLVIVLVFQHYASDFVSFGTYAGPAFAAS